MKKFKLTTFAGNTFSDVADEAKSRTDIHELVEFEFNGVVCLVNKNTNLDWLYRDYSNSWTMGWKKVGPNCVKKYSAEVQKEFDDKTVIREEERKKQQAEYDKKEAAERLAFEEKTKGIEIELADAKSWSEFKESNKDPYGACCVEYAEGWAKLMQIEFANGKLIKDCAKATSYEMGFLGITGFMYGCAVSMLAKCWKHGEALRLWHNLATQIKNEGEKANESGGVLNPALISIGK
jgi:hypothetical protein